MARLLDQLTKRLGSRSDDELRSELAERTQALREFRREHQQFAERAHASVDATRAAARAAVDVELRRVAESQRPLEPHPGTPSGQILERVGALAIVAGFTPDALAKRWHEIVDECGTFSPLSVSEFEAEEAKAVAEIRDREVELARRRAAADQERVARELAALEERAGAA